MGLTVKALIKQLVDLEDYDTANAFITIAKSQYAEDLERLLSEATTDNKLIKLVYPSKEGLPKIVPITNNQEVYFFKDFKDTPNSEVLTKEVSLAKEIYSKLTKEQKMILLTIAWANRPSPASFLVKHCQRLSSYFNLHKDSRWAEYYANNRSKMQTIITNTLIKFKKSDIIVETKMSALNKHSVYNLSKLGLDISHLIAREVSFSLNTSI